MNKNDFIVMGCIVIYILASIAILQSIVVCNVINAIYIIIFLVLILFYCIYKMFEIEKEIYIKEAKIRQKIYDEAIELITKMSDRINKQNGGK